MPLLAKVQTNPDWFTMGDAEYAANLDGTNFDAVAGYLWSMNNAGPAWTDAQWFSIPGPKLPIFVANMNGRLDAESALGQLSKLNVPEGQGHYVAYDMETRVDITCVSAFGAIMQHYGFKVLVYGSASTVFGNPELNGYWVADYLYKPFMHSHPGTRITQWTDGPLFDQSTGKPWILSGFWR